MNIVTQLENMGLSLSLDQDSSFILGGLKKLPPESRRQAVEVAREHKPAILEELKNRAEAFIARPADAPAASKIGQSRSAHHSAAALAHARRMLVPCPAHGRELHCWYCSRCAETASCQSWRARRYDVEFFRQSEKPESVYLLEEAEAAEVLQ